MDRFIVIVIIITSAPVISFKIQYGQIYRCSSSFCRLCILSLKSNMDRFIVCLHLRGRSKQKSLKSNMDRFIENIATNLLLSNMPLKSNMDRFIEFEGRTSPIDGIALKSNMDRFIGAVSVAPLYEVCYFKIQYGQIYRKS